MPSRVFWPHRLTQKIPHGTTPGVKRKKTPRKVGGRPLDPGSASARAVRLVMEEGMSQREAADAVGITASAVSRALAARERRWAA